MGPERGPDTLSKHHAIRRALAERPVPYTTLRRLDRPDLGDTMVALAAVHAVGYLTDVSRGTGSEWGELGDTAFWSAAGVVAATKAVLDDGFARAGSLSSGLHHARYDGGAGFCTLNGLAAAAWWAASAGAKVLIVDLDAHHGGGTYSLIEHVRRRFPNIAPIRQLDVSTDPFDRYFPHPVDSKPVRVRHRARYLGTVERQLCRAERPDVVLYNAGMDPHEDCWIGGLHGITADTLRARDRMVFEWAGSTPVVWVPAGGYTSEALPSEALADLHRTTAWEANRWS